MHRDHRKIPRAARGLDGPGPTRIQRHAGICSKRPATHTCSIGRSTTNRSGCKPAPDRLLSRLLDGIERCRRAGASRSHRPPIRRDDRRPVRGAAGAVAHRGVRVLERRPMPPLGHFLLIRFEWLPAGTDGRGESRGGKDRRSATRLIPPFRMIRRPSRRTCSRGTLRAWSYTSPRRYRFETRYRVGYKRMTIQCHRALILGCGAKECHSVMVPGGDAPFLDIMTVQDLRLEIRRDAPQQPRFPRS